MENDANLSIYKAARIIKRKDNSLYNALRSIYDDSIFVGEISQLWPDLPLLANLRCGLWYSSKFDATCYFKSTDGHTNNWSFSTSRLNLHVAHLAGQKGGCIIVDSTRKGKRFPDSMSKTIPIWTCVLNRSIRNHLEKMHGDGTVIEKSEHTNWDCSLHLPLWVPETEKASINERLEEWTKQLDASGADIALLASCLKKPLRPLWISQKTVIWLNEVPDHESWDFTPIILVSASWASGSFQHTATSEFSWHYIAGAGDDEESWARGLSPSLFWDHIFEIISLGPDLCNQKVADIIEKDRVYRARRGQITTQVTVKAPKMLQNKVDALSSEPVLHLDTTQRDTELKSGGKCSTLFWLGSTNLAVGSITELSNAPNVDSVINCDQESMLVSDLDFEEYLHLPTVSSKLDRFSLLNNLPAALKFAKSKLREGKRLLVCGQNGEDISICMCLAIMTSLFDSEGTFDDGKFFKQTRISKEEMHRRLVFICKFAVNARPSRGNLKQVFGFLSRGRASST